MDKRTIGIILLVIGIIVLLLSVTADVTGIPSAIGIGGWPGFGTWQIVGTIAGLVLAAAGAFLMSRQSA